MIIDAYYQLMGDRLIVDAHQPVRPDSDVSKARHIEFDGDALVETGPDGSVVRKERVGSGGKSARLVGSWKYRHYTDLVAFEKYTDDGRLCFRLPMRSSVGRYILKGNELLMVRPNLVDARMTLDLLGDTLSLVHDGETTKYRRVGAGPWYERENIVRYPKK